MQPALRDLEDETWIALQNVDCDGADRKWAFGEEEGRRAVLHGATTLRRQSVLVCPVATVEVEGVWKVVSSRTVTVTRRWYTDLDPPGGDPDLIATNEWIDTIAPVDLYHLIYDEEGNATSPSCEFTHTQEDPPADWDTPPDGYNGPGQPVAYYVDTTTTDDTYATQDAAGWRSLCASNLRDADLGQIKYLAGCNRRRAWLPGSGQAAIARDYAVWEVGGVSTAATFDGAAVEWKRIRLSLTGRGLKCLLRWRIGEGPPGDLTWTDHEEELIPGEDVTIDLEPGVGTGSTEIEMTVRLMPLR